MLFDQTEICDIVRAHVVREWGVPDTSINGVSWKATPSQERGKPDTLTILLDISTVHGDPYRTPPESPDKP